MSVAGASGLMAAALLLSRALGLVRDAIISASFGIDSVRDAYQAAFTIPDLLFYLVAGGALSSAFIPVFTRHWSQGEHEDAWKVFSAIVTVMGIAIVAFIVVAEIFALPLINLLTPGLPESVQPLAADMARILLPSQLGFLIGAMMFATMNARGHFAVPAMSPNIYNLGIIFGAAFLAPVLPIPIFGPTWGALVGALLGNLLIPILAMRRFGAKFRPSLDVSHPSVRRVFALMVPVVFGLSLPGVFPIVNKWFASFHGEGVISALEIGNRIMQAPLGVFGQAFAIAVFPTLITLHVQKKPELFLGAMSRTLRTVMFIGVFVSVILYVLSEDVIRVLNQWGKFDESDTQLVTGGLQMYAIGVFAWCGHPVLMRSFFALEDTLTPILLGTLTSFVFVGLCWALGSTALGYKGLALAVSLSAVLLLVLLLLGLRARLGRIDGARIARMLLLSALAALATGLAVWYLASLVPSPEGVKGNLLAAVRLVVLGLGAAWVYLFVGKALRLEEAEYALRAVLRRNRPQNGGDSSR